jgi:DNA-binding MarR family transcriptional regulator
VGRQPRHELDHLLLTTAARILLVIDADSDALFSEIADRAAVDERTVSRELDHLERAGYLSRHRHGKRNHSTIHDQAEIQDIGASGTIGELLNALRLQ